MPTFRATRPRFPVSDQAVLSPGGALPSYFAGLLPERRRLGVLRRAVKTSADDELSLLLAVGADAIGDVQVVPWGVTPAEVPPRVGIEDIGRVSFAELLVELGLGAQRTALPGVQDKTSAAMINLPSRGPASVTSSSSTRSASTSIWLKTRRSFSRPHGHPG